LIDGMWQREARWFRRTVLAQDTDMRLDRWLRLQFPSLPQSLVQQQLRKRKIRLEAAPRSETPTPTPPLERERVHAGSILRPGVVVAIDARLFQDRLVPEADALDELDTAASRETEKEAAPPSPKVLRELLRRVAYQDEHFVVLNKPHGLAVQVQTLSLSCDQWRR
jgi:23S rRNA-/tRNA-specific pseudouridylate synthase